MAKLSNPLSFTAHGPVTVITTVIYLAIIIPLVIIHTGVPPAPKSSKSILPLNLTEALLDLQLLSSSYHPFNSHQNDHVHEFLLHRIRSIIHENHPHDQNTSATNLTSVFDDKISNLTFSSAGSTANVPGISVYFESTNIIVYIRGTQDDQTNWWEKTDGKPSHRNGVLVNAHYDSVSTGFGATDDGVGVITILQLLRYYTDSKNQPKNGLVLLLNNGEEDFLNGAAVFSQHPMAKIVNTFLNLEGAGAGGRAALFRSTDTEVTRAYAKSPYPFGTVISADGFNRGLVRSQTDYIIFNGKLGFRGLDVAFLAPRARYHTNQDDARHTGKDSIWHMLSAAVATTKHLTSSPFRQENGDSQVDSRAVWFDLFGRQFIIVEAHTIFALSVTVLVAGPILLLLIMLLLHRADKFYLFSGSRKIHTLDGEDSVALNGWRGFFRFPLILAFSCAAPVALAYLLFKENQFIAYSSEWAVWSMMVSSFIFVAWFCCRTADFARPSALTRAFGFTWLWLGWWLILLAATVFEEQFHLSGGYFVLFYTASVFVTTLLSYIELFSLPKKTKFCRGKLDDSTDDEASRSRSVSRSRNQAIEDTGDHGDDTEEEPTESSGLLGRRTRGAFKNYTQDNEEGTTETAPKEDSNDAREEQEWSKSQWSFLWILQILILAPINLVMIGEIALLLTTALDQTGPDGSSMFLVYISIAIFTIFLFSPVVPILHRFTWHIPMFLFLVLVGTLIYNLIAFPFSAQNRMKLYFQQEVDLDSGHNNVSFVGVTPFLQQAISSIPSSAGQSLSCISADTFSDRQKCSWHGIFPVVADHGTNKTFKNWISFSSVRLSNTSEETTIRFKVQGRNTRACKIYLDSEISEFLVHGQAPVDKRFSPVPESGSKEIRLWSRTWDRKWTVDVKWKGKKNKKGISGKVGCIWSDVNQKGTIPAFDEALHNVPDWIAITKGADGIVEGRKSFVV